MHILGISCFYHDSAASLVRDGKVIAATAEERFTRKKHDNNFPYKSIDFCLDFAGLAINELDAIVFYEKPIVKFERILSQHLDHFPKSYASFFNTSASWLNQKLNIKKILKDELHYHGEVLFIPHHLSHAASAYYLSPFSEASIVTIDGVGEWATTTVGIGKKAEVSIQKEICFPHSLGLLYSTLTTYLGFSANDAEYKVMGLAAYGDPKPFRKHFNKIIQIKKDGSYCLNMEYFDFDWAEHMASSKMVELFGYPAREPESKAYSYHENIAASLQEKLEQVVFNLLDATYKEHQLPNLCLAGGVALNSVMNGKILSKTKFKELFIPPDPSDAGGSMGAALYVWHQTQKKKTNPHFSPYLGPNFPSYQVEQILKQHKLKYEFVEKKKLVKKMAKCIVDQKVIGWFQGRMEWGPRALGNRSILASAATEKMKDIINARVKHRELFRPFAPVILEKYVSTYFEADKNVPISAKWMLMVYPFKKIGKKNVPAVYHVDGTGRLQTLSRTDNSLYYDLVLEHYRLTGVPIIINTSFNVRGEPIVCTPEDAINCFLKTDIDYLVIDQFLVSK
ncbi:MAG: carbamoyltransferase [Patescibacteria group bacterium]